MLSVENIFYVSMEDEEKEEQLVEKHKEFFSTCGDHFTYMNVYIYIYISYKAFIKNGSNSDWCQKHGIHFRSLRTATHIKDQLEGDFDKHKRIIESCGSHKTPILKSLAEGFFMNIARRGANNVYRTVVDINHDAARMARLHPSCTLSHLGRSPEYVVFHEVFIIIFS